MELIHLPCLLRDTVFGWRIRRGNFSPFRAAPLSPQFSPSKSLSNCDCPGPETLPVAAKTLDASSHLSPLIADGKRSYPQDTRSFFNNVRSRLGVGVSRNRGLKWNV